MKNTTFFLLFIFCSFASPFSRSAPAGNLLLYMPAIVSHGCQSYSVTRINSNGKIEHRFFCESHHFMTLVDEAGTMNLRPHPGMDVNGWGSSWYAQPFLPGAKLKHTSIHSLTAAADGIHIVASGLVSKGTASSYGTWSMSLDFTYNKKLKKITGSGNYTIQLAGPLASVGADLNLYKIASNYLDNVPLLSGGSGDTGDMQKAEILYGPGETPFSYSPWIPPDTPGFFPTDETDHLTVHVIGQCNDVDTAAQGDAPIQPAYKPNMKVTLASQHTGTPIRFGAIYDTAKSQNFAADNVGITPIIPSSTATTTYNFAVTFESTPLSGDGGQPCQ